MQIHLLGCRVRVVRNVFFFMLPLWRLFGRRHIVNGIDIMVTMAWAPLWFLVLFAACLTPWKCMDLSLDETGYFLQDLDLLRGRRFSCAVADFAIC